jgi:hypothetical protein
MSIIPENPYTEQENQENTGKFDIRHHLEKLKPDGGKNVKNGDHSFHCPVCGSHNFKVNVKTGKYGSFGCNCAESESGKAQIRQALSPAKKKRQASKIEYHYPTKPECFSTYVRVTRIDDGDGKKTFVQAHWNDKWVTGLGKVTYADILLYQDAKLRGAIAQGQPIFVVEGESCADALGKLGLVATCNIGGSGKWQPHHTDALAGANVVLCPDADVPGLKHMEAIANSDHRFNSVQWLYAAPTSWRWERLPPNQGLDIGDWIEDGATLDTILGSIEPERRAIAEPDKPLSKADELRLEIQAVLAETDPIARALAKAKLCPRFNLSKSALDELIATSETRKTRPKPQPISMGALLDLKTEAQRWIVPGLLPHGEAILLNALPKVGKTLLAVDLAFAVATGGTFLQEPVEQGSVLFISVDESLRSTRAKLLNRGFRGKDPIHVLPEWDISQMGELEEMLDRLRPKLVIIDSLKRITVGRNLSENSAEFADNIYLLKELLARYGAAGVFIHHATKDKEAIGIGKVRGSTAITGAVWGTWLLDHCHGGSDFDPRDPMRMLECICRDSEGAKLRIQLNPDDFSFTATYDAEALRAKTQLQQLIDLLRNYPTGLHAVELQNLCPNISNPRLVLARGVAKGIVSQEPSKTTRGSVYSVPIAIGEPTPEPVPEPTDPPLPLTEPTFVTPNPETLTQQELDECNNQQNNQCNNLPNRIGSEPVLGVVTPVVTLPKPLPSNECVNSHPEPTEPVEGGGSVGSGSEPILTEVKTPIAISHKAGIKHKDQAFTWQITAIRDGRYELKLAGTNTRKTRAVHLVPSEFLVYEANA